MGENHRMVEKYRRVRGPGAFLLLSEYCLGSVHRYEMVFIRGMEDPHWTSGPPRAWRQTHLADTELYPVAGAPGLNNSQRNGSPGLAERMALHTQTEATGLGHQRGKKLWGLEGTALEQGLAEPEGGEA